MKSEDNLNRENSSTFTKLLNNRDPINGLALLLAHICDDPFQQTWKFGTESSKFLGIFKTHLGLCFTQFFQHPFNHRCFWRRE